MTHSHSITKNEIYSRARVIDLDTGEVIREAPAGAGFINGAISARNRRKLRAEVEVMQGGIRVNRNLSTKKLPKEKRKVTSKRGPIRGFSKKSRNRMMRKLMKLDWEEIRSGKHSEVIDGAFLTLTYPSVYPKEWREWKDELRAFRERVRRQFGDEVSGLWKLEFQERGAPHFHVLVYFPDGVSVGWLRKWVSRSWYEVVGSGDPKHLKAGTNVSRVYGQAGKLMRYLSKYMAKEQATERPTGRIWGLWGSLPAGAVHTLEVELVEFMRRVRKWGKHSPYLRNLVYPSGVLIYGDRRKLLKLMMGITGG